MPGSPGLIPRVAQMELFAASSGSSMRSVLGTHSDFSSLSSFSGREESLECFPRGEPLPEQLLLLDDDGDMQPPFVLIHGMFHAVAGQLDKQPHSAGGTRGYGNGGAESLEATGIMGEFMFIHGAELVLQLSDWEADSGMLVPGTIIGTLFHPMFHGYM
ncbi:Os01g0263900 [Oryza sativa Japonica Group]|uniref:Os01g0263900 protein n=1 Tax=Oryza sativa subsp. japonica TaxID=39947 RepID=A0A0P0V0W6_ORYSJ|nr:hypothetical protein EE612_001614 [Oryza sativa]BAS71446.1 Os01g0263900 [Oryza sativa Japonica Group]